LCHTKNICQANTDNSCWCHDVIVPQKLLDLVPEKLKGKSCICRRCIEKFNNNNRSKVT